MEGGSGKNTSTGLTQNIAALLCYVLGFVSGIIFLIIEKENRFVKFHAMQSLFTFLPLFILSCLAGIIPLVGGIVSFFAGVLQFILWVVLMYKAFRNEWFRLPIAGEIAEQQINK